MGKQCRPMYSIYIVDCTSVQRLMMFTDANTSTPLTSQPFTQAHTHTYIQPSWQTNPDITPISYLM